MEWNWRTGWLLGWLMVWTASDIRRREICCWQVLVVLISGTVWQAGTHRLFIWDTAGGLLAGCAVWGFSCLSDGRFGRGDALVFLCLGLYLGLGVSLSVLTISLLLSSVSAAYLIVVKRKPRHWTIPFIPFLLAGYVVSFLIIR